MQSKANAPLIGVDISSLNSISDETLLFSQIDFMYVRAYGRDHTGTGDTQTANFVASARRNNCPVGAYYFGVPFVDASAGVSTDAQIASNAETQAQQFIDKLYSVFGQGNVGDLIPCVDVEQYVDATTQYGHTATQNSQYPQAVMTNAQLVVWIKAFKNYFNSHTGKRLGMYTGEYWIQAPPPDGIGLTNAQLTDINSEYLPLWIARYDEYNTPNDVVANLGTWTNYISWQYTGIGNASAYGVFHVDNYLDLNRASDLSLLYAQDIVTAPTPTGVNLGANIVDKMFLGSTPISRMFLGTAKIFELPTAPTTTISPASTIQNTIPFTVTLTTDEVGATIYYKIGTGTQQTYTGPFSVNQNSPNVNSPDIPITYWAVGADGAETEKTITYDTRGSIPAKPAVTVINGANQVVLDWDPMQNATSYSVYRSTVLGDEGTALATYFSPTTYTDNTAVSPNTYYYTVRANNFQNVTKSDQITGKPTAPVTAGWQYIRITMYGDNNGYLFRTVEWEAWNVGATTNVLRDLQPFATTNAGFTPQNYTVTVCTDGSYDVNKRFAFMNNTNNTPATCTYKLTAPTALSDFRQWTYSISGDQRKMKFKVEVSKDNVAWTLVADYSTNTTIANNIDGKFPNAINFPPA